MCVGVSEWAVSGGELQATTQTRFNPASLCLEGLVDSNRLCPVGSSRIRRCSPHTHTHTHTNNKKQLCAGQGRHTDVRADVRTCAD